MTTRCHAGYSSTSGGTLRVLSDEAIEHIHLATLRILERTGIKVECDDVLDIFADNHCLVDRETCVVKIPSWVVMDALSVTPPTVTIYGRDPAKDVVVDSNRVYFETGQYATQTYDLTTGERRLGCLQDSADAARIVDGLDNIDVYHTPIVLPLDYDDDDARGPRAYLESLQNTTKPIHCGQMNSGEIEALIEMGAIVQGGMDALRERSPLYVGAFSTTPLTYAYESWANGIKLARAGLIPTVYSMAMLGASTPASVAGLLVLQNAEMLAEVALLQMVERGTRIVLAPCSVSFDMRKGLVASGSPETTLIHCGSAQLAQHYHLPCMGTPWWSDSKLNDYQAGHENSMAAVAAALAGENLISGAGLLECGLAFSPVHLVLADEVAGMVRHLLRGVPVSDETLMIEEIDEVGHGNQFLSRTTTRSWARTASDPRIIDRRSYDDWLAAGATDMATRASAEAKRILAEHEVEPLPEDVLGQLEDVIAKYQPVPTLG